MWKMKWIFIALMGFLPLSLAQDVPPKEPEIEVTPATYMVTSPKVLRRGTDLEIGVTILAESGPVEVTATLTKGKVTYTSGSATIENSAVVSIPVPTSADEGAYTLTVTGSGGLTFTDSATLTLDPHSVSVFIQTDKAIYKPEQLVQFRVMPVKPDLTPLGIPVDIHITDKNDNKIKQWLNQTSDTGIISKSLQLSDQPPLGDWKITVKVLDEKTEKVFTVEEFVLPKFEVKINPSKPYVLNGGNEDDTAISGNIEALYTYGKNVKGKVSLQVYLKNNRNKVTKTYKIDGKVGFSVSIADLKRVSRENTIHYFDIVCIAEVTEDLTNIKLSSDELTIPIHQYGIKLEFMEASADNLRPGLSYTAYVKASKPDGSPLDAGHGKSIKFSATTNYENEGTGKYKESTTVDSTHVIPDAGVVVVPITDIAMDISSMRLEATLVSNRNIRADSKTVSKFSTKTNAGVQISLLTALENMKAGETAEFQVKSTKSITSFNYVVIARGNIIDISPKSMSGTVATFTIDITSVMAPTARIIVFYIDGNEVIADSLEVKVDGAFKNDVTVSFSTDQGKPAEEVTVDVTAMRDSTVGILAIDQSVLLLKTGNDITQADVLGELGSYDTSEDDDDSWQGPWFKRRRRRSFWWPWFNIGADATEMFENAGVKILTDAYIHKEQDDYPIFEMDGPVWAALPDGAIPKGEAVDTVDESSTAALATPTRTRTLFPDTWLWDNTVVNANGRASVSAVIPDTITSWVASAFALHPTAGLGVAPTTAKLTVFQPFFISLTLPYSVVRGEEFGLIITVFNYMDDDMEVTLTLKKSLEFKVKHGNDIDSMEPVNKEVVEKIMIPANSGKSQTIWIVTEELGNVKIEVMAQSTAAADAVERTLLVEPEGVTKYINKMVFHDLSAGDYSETYDLSVPPTAINGSKRGEICVVGDIMGPALDADKLSKMLRVPTGCGEQNMLGFVPNVFVLKYLEAVDRDTSAIRTKATANMEIGYQRELNYQKKKNDVGSFSAFGDHDPEGSMWLTAFVIRSFAQARPYISDTIDNNKIKDAMVWIINEQESDGLFPENGKVCHKDMQGGSATKATMTSYVLLALLENKDMDGAPDNTASAITKAVGFVEGQIDETDDPYALAIMAYALTVAKSSRAQETINKLMSKKISSGDQTYWEPEGYVEPPVCDPSMRWCPYNHQAGATLIETAAYALLTFVAKDDMNNALPVLRWLTKQRNSLGGFSSTQDTVMGLWALSEFGIMATSGDINVAVSVTADTFTHSFDDITNTNAVILQCVVIPQENDEVAVSMTGQGAGLVQVSLQYNEQDEIVSETDSMVLTVTTNQIDVNNIVVETCAKNKKEGLTGMFVVEMGVPSGFEANTKDLENEITKDTNDLSRVEKDVKGKKVVAYLDTLPQNEFCMTIKNERVAPVSNLQKSAVKAYSYYNVDESLTVLFDPMAGSSPSVCDVCGVDCGCDPQTGGNTSSQTIATSLGLLLTFIVAVIASSLVTC